MVLEQDLGSYGMVLMVSKPKRRHRATSTLTRVIAQCDGALGKINKLVGHM